MVRKRMTFSEELKNKFKNFVTSRCGLYFRDYDLRSLEDAVTARMQSCGFDSALAYHNYLTTSEKKEDEFRELLNLLIVNHTYFFRNEPHFRALREKVLPEIIKNKRAERHLLGDRKGIQSSGKPKIRIWSAGCSTGEEPYSIAMVIRDLMGDLDEWDVEIYATDVSTHALEKAKTGVYGKNSMRLVNKEYEKKYFVKKADSPRSAKYEIRSAIRDMVNFSVLNLMDGSFPSNFDIIFCRNVILYFELPTTIEVVNKLYSSLADGGYQFMGYCESLRFMSDKFRMEDWKDGIFYRKAPKEPVTGSKVLKPAVEEAEEILEEVSRAELEAEREAQEKRKTGHSKEMEHLLVQIIKFTHLKEYDKALSLIENALSMDKGAVDPYYLAAEVRMRQGRFDEAKKYVSTILDLNPFFAPAHCLFGCIYIEEGNLEHAKKSLRKALYLDKDFPMAHFKLANVHETQGRTEDAIREHRNTLKVLGKNSPGDVIAYTGGFDAASLRSVCSNNIERLKVEG